MRNPDHHHLRQWLAAERSGDEERAEGALRLVFRRLADPSPSLGFADAVMARLLPLPQEQIAVGWRVLLATCLFLVALSVAVLPFIVWPLAEVVRLSSLVELAASAVVVASDGLATWLSFWQSLSEATRVLMTVISKPPVAILLTSLAALGAVAVRFLVALEASERSVPNV